MNDKESWEIDDPKNPWLIEREEEKNIPQREGKLIKEKEPTFFKGGEKVKIGKIVELIKKGKGGWNDSDSKEMLEIFEELTRGRTHLNRDDINRIINSLERVIPYEKDNKKRKLVSKLKELI